MNRKIVNLNVRVELTPDRRGTDGDAREDRRRAMLENLHTVLVQHCPGLTLQALEQMLGNNTFGQVLDQLAMAKLLEHPQGRA